MAARSQTGPAGQPRTPGDVIFAALTGHGYTPDQAYGIMGNLKVESSFNPGAYNSGEGAIGIAQWEGSRRTALQQFAAKRGTSETDLTTQIAFLLHELDAGGYAKTIKSMSDPGQIAAYVDANYERSSGAARVQREQDAVDMAGTGTVGGVATAGADSLVAGVKPERRTKADFVAQFGDLGAAIFNAVPELQNLMNKAVAGDWSANKFVDQVEASDWYRNHSQTARSVIAQKASDPASYQQSLNNEVNQVQNLANQLGISRQPNGIHHIAVQALLTGNDGNQQWIQQQLASGISMKDVGDVSKLRGGLAATANQLQQYAAEYDTGWTPAEIAQKAQRVIAGLTTTDTYQQQAVNVAKSKYPGITDQLDQGLTLADIAQPYQQTMASLLEVSPNSVGLNSPLIKKALQGVPNPGSGKTTAQQVPLWQFEQMVKADPRWQFTDNARNATTTALAQIGRDFGFSS